MTTATIGQLDLVTSALGTDLIEIEIAASGLSRRIAKDDFVGATLTGEGSIDTGGHALVVPAAGTVALKTGTPVANNIAQWDNSTTVEDSGIAASNISLLTGDQTIAGVKTFTSNIVASAIKQSQTVIANGAVVDLSTLTPQTNGFLLITVIGQGRGALYYVRGGYNAMSELAGDTANLFTATKDSALSVNLYYETGYKIQNKTGSSQSITILGIGG